MPKNNFALQHRDPTSLRLSVQAKSNECDSSVLLVRVSWNGQWHDGAQEMRRHMVIETVDRAAPNGNVGA
ncbi:MAG TPA: hypothetical protein VI750_06690 [Pyrinomonadaceae bacterium]|nr:hypothetical protein [Pyrinomonadaceae bacterium]